MLIQLNSILTENLIRIVQAIWASNMTDNWVLHFPQTYIEIERIKLVWGTVLRNISIIISYWSKTKLFLILQFLIWRLSFFESGKALLLILLFIQRSTRWFTLLSDNIWSLFRCVYTVHWSDCTYLRVVILKIFFKVVNWVFLNRFALLFSYV